MAELGDPVVVGPEDVRHQCAVGDDECVYHRRRIDYAHVYPVDIHVLHVLFGDVAPRTDVFHDIPMGHSFGVLEPPARLGSPGPGVDQLVAFAYPPVVAIFRTDDVGSPVPEPGLHSCDEQVCGLENVTVRRNHPVGSHPPSPVYAHVLLTDLASLRSLSPRAAVARSIMLQVPPSVKALYSSSRSVTLDLLRWGEWYTNVVGGRRDARC